MTQFQVQYSTQVPEGADVLIPGGLTTPHGTMIGAEMAGVSLEDLTEVQTGQRAYLARAVGPEVALTLSFDSTATGAYPDAMFRAHNSRFTRFADDLVAEVGEIAPDASGLDRITAIACATAERFTYGHPEARFNDGMDEIPALGCGLVEGSCVDINTYFIASLRAAGFEAGYATGFFFPAEKGDHCEDGHCWVVTRVDGETQEWDIAHHLKLGTRDIKPALNPKPGFRAACFHSMGLDFPSLGVTDWKALIEPIAIVGGTERRFDRPQIRLRHPALAAAE